MKITNLDPKKYKRFFAFGASFTIYNWPTWADVIGQDFDFYENWAEQGAGNHFIFNSIIEADARYNFNSEDLIIVAWSKMEYEDIYSNRKWVHSSVSRIVENYGDFWVRKFWFDSRSHLIKSLAYMKSIQIILESKNTNWANLFWSDYYYDGLDDFYSQLTEEKKKELEDTWKENIKYLFKNGPIPDMIENKDVIELYRDVFLNISGVYRQFNDECIKDRKVPNNDHHPTPNEALLFLDWVWPDNTISNNAREYTRNWNEKIFLETDNIKSSKIVKRL